MKRCEEQTSDPSPLAAVALLEYVVGRQKSVQETDVLDIDDAVDEWLVQACAARRQFREVATPALRSTRRRAALGLLAEDYQRAVDHYANRQEVPLVEMVDEVLAIDAVQDIIKRSGTRPGLIDAVRDLIKQSDGLLRVDGDTLILISPERERKVINDACSPSNADSLLSMIARTWGAKGRGLAALVVGFDENGENPNELSWRDGLAQGLVYGSWFLDRDVRTLEDLRSLPAVEGNSIAVIVVAAVILVGFILTWIAKCIDDPDVALVVRFTGEILSSGWLVHAVGGVPIEECRTDASTGATRCARI